MTNTILSIKSTNYKQHRGKLLYLQINSVFVLLIISNKIHIFKNVMLLLFVPSATVAIYDIVISYRFVITAASFASDPSVTLITPLLIHIIVSFTRLLLLLQYKDQLVLSHLPVLLLFS